MHVCQKKTMIDPFCLSLPSSHCANTRLDMFTLKNIFSDLFIVQNNQVKSSKSDQTMFSLGTKLMWRPDLHCRTLLFWQFYTHMIFLESEDNYISLNVLHFIYFVFLISKRKLRRVIPFTLHWYLNRRQKSWSVLCESEFFDINFCLFCWPLQKL